MASTALESTHSNTEEPSMETSSFQTDQLEVAPVNASYDAQRTPKMPVKRASLRRGQKKWSALKKRRKSLAFGRKENETNGSRKPLTLENRQLKLQALASIKVTNAGISFGENHIIIGEGFNCNHSSCLKIKGTMRCRAVCLNSQNQSGISLVFLHCSLELNW